MSISIEPLQVITCGEPWLWQRMDASDWISIIAILVSIYLVYRTENIRYDFQRLFKRYDLLHSARYRCIEEADDCLVDVQRTMFNLSMAVDRDKGDFKEAYDAYQKASVAATISQIKAEKYFDKVFNDRFRELTKPTQDLHGAIHEMIKSDVTEKELNHWHQVKFDSIEKIKELLPPFRALLAHMLQHDLEESKKRPVHP